MTTNNGQMRFAFPMVQLGEVVRPAERFEPPQPGRPYRQIGVRLWGQGAYERETVDGAETKYNRLNRVETGDIIVNKIWARNGSVTVVPNQLAGCFCSGEFPLFQPTKGELLPAWFFWLTKTRWLWDQCDKQSRGTSGKNRIRPEMFLAIEIPLPPLEEQRRIVARIDRLAAKIEEARALRRRADEENLELCRAILRDERFGPPTPTPMRELVTWRRPNVQVVGTQSYQFAGVYCFGRGVFSGQRRIGMDFAYKQLTQIRAGEFVYPKLMAWEGALAIVPEECDGHFVSPEFSVFTVHEDRVLPEVLDVYFRSPAVWPSLSGASTGTNVRRKRLNPKDFLDYVFPLPDRRVQLALRAVYQRMNELQPLKDQSPLLDTLLPSILDRAFRGEL
jgi:type I restriction enzyme S subunit